MNNKVAIGEVVSPSGFKGQFKIKSFTEKKDNFFKKHDHAELTFNKNKLIYNDPRRFGSIHITKNYKEHFLIKNLGPEPLSKEFSADYLYEAVQVSKTNIKNFIMNQKNVVGIGNIYASEILFRSALDPRRISNTVTKNECGQITKNAEIV